MKFLKVGNNEYEIYLSSNGVCNIEERTNKSITELQSKTGFNTIRLLLWGCLWERNKLTIEDVGNLLDEWLNEDENNNMVSLGKIISDEIQKWSKAFTSKKNIVTNPTQINK